MDFLESIKDILGDELLEQILSSLQERAFGEVADYIETAMRTMVQQAVGFIVLMSIPALIFAIAYCFFGIKVYRVFLVIGAVFGGGTLGSLFVGSIVLVTGLGGIDKISADKIIGAIGAASAGAVIGFILSALIFGVLAWFLYKVFLFIEAFATGLFTTTAILYFVTDKKIVLSLCIGVVVGLVLAIMVCIYAKVFIMIITAYKGAGKIAGTMSLFFIINPITHCVVYFLLLAVFTGLGFFIQYRFFAGNYSREKTENPVLARYKLFCIEGIYKGAEFDVEGAVTLGRDGDNCNVVFPDTCAGVSRIQCEIRYDSRIKSVTIVDRYSSYGTTLNGTRLEINRVMPMNNGDVIMFGENNVFKLGY